MSACGVPENACGILGCCCGVPENACGILGCCCHNSYGRKKANGRMNLQKYLRNLKIFSTFEHLPLLYFQTISSHT